MASLSSRTPYPSALRYAFQADGADGSPFSFHNQTNRCCVLVSARAASKHGKGKIGVVHFDAHYDAASFGIGHHLTHGTPVRKLIAGGYVEGKNFIQVGLRGYMPGDDDLAWMRDQGMRFHFMAEVEKYGWKQVMDRAIAEAREGTDYVFISLDIDVLDPAYAPGTGTPEPNGLTPRELFPLLRRLGAESNLVGIELVELNPLVDPTYVTPLVANRCAREMLTGIAMRRLGLTEEHYLAPEAVDHGNGIVPWDTMPESD